MDNRGDSRIKHTTVVPTSVVDLLSKTLIGTEGSLYQLLDTPSKIHELDSPHFYFIERNEKALGTITICERNVTVGEKEITGRYIRYFAFDEIFRGNSDKAIKRNSLFDQHWKNIFDTGRLEESSPEKLSTFFWAFIDPQNFRSFRMNERFGFENIGQFQTTAFSRFYPRNSLRVNRLKKEEHQLVLEEIKKFYHDFVFVSDTQLFKHDNYFVLKDNGKIVAGIQANPTKFKIVSLPGFGGKIALKVFPKLPFLRRMMNPKEHQFLATEGLFYLPGHENVIEELLSAVLFQQKHCSLLIWEDVKKPVLRNLNLSLGFLQNIKKDNFINVVFKPVNLSSQQLTSIKNSPKYLSGFDMT